MKELNQVWYIQMIAELREYFSTPSTPYDFTQRLQEGIKIFAIIGSIVFVVLQFTPRFSILFSLFYAWIIVALSFGGVMWFLREIEVRFLGRWFGEMNYGKQWLLVFTKFLIGWGVYIVVEGIAIPPTFPEYLDMPEGRQNFIHFLRVLPIWFIVTYMIFQMEIKKTLAKNLEQARQINQLLDQRSREFSSFGTAILAQENSNAPRPSSAESQKFKFSRNNQIEELNPEIISHISVEEHYSSIFVKTVKDVEEIQVRLSLKEALNQLPQDSFIRIHRSHVINLSHVSHIEQTARSYQIFLGDNEFALPLSRHRVPQVLPVLQEFLKTD